MLALFRRYNRAQRCLFKMFAHIHLQWWRVYVFVSQQIGYHGKRRIYYSFVCNVCEHSNDDSKLSATEWHAIFFFLFGWLRRWQLESKSIIKLTFDSVYEEKNADYSFRYVYKANIFRFAHIFTIERVHSAVPYSFLFSSNLM